MAAPSTAEAARTGARADARVGAQVGAGQAPPDRTSAGRAPLARVGVDLVPLARVAELLADGAGRALRRMLSTAELAASRTPNGAADPEGIAGRIAAKEAVFKVLAADGHDGQTLPWLGIEILRGPGGRPHVRLGGRAAEIAARAGLGPVDVSISHSGGFAVAVAAAVADTRTDSYPYPPHPPTRLEENP